MRQDGGYFLFYFGVLSAQLTQEEKITEHRGNEKEKQHFFFLSEEGKTYRWLQSIHLSFFRGRNSVLITLLHFSANRNVSYLPQFVCRTIREENAFISNKINKKKTMRRKKKKARKVAPHTEVLQKKKKGGQQKGNEK